MFYTCIPSLPVAECVVAVNARVPAQRSDYVVNHITRKCCATTESSILQNDSPTGPLPPSPIGQHLEPRRVRTSTPAHAAVVPSEIGFVRESVPFV